MVSLGVRFVVEAYGSHDAYDEEVSDDRHHGRTCRGGKSQRAHLLGGSCKEGDTGIFGKSAFWISGDADVGDLRDKSSGEIDELEYLTRLSGIGNQEHDVIGTDYTEISMLSLTGMKEEGRCPCR